MDDERTNLGIALDAREAMNQVRRLAALAKDMPRDTDRLWIIALGSEGAYSWDGFKVCLHRIDGTTEEIGPAFNGTTARRQVRKHASALDDFGLLKELPIQVKYDDLPLPWCLICRLREGHQVVGVGRGRSLDMYGEIPSRVDPGDAGWLLGYKRISRTAAQAACDHLAQGPGVGWTDYELDDAGVVVLRKGAS